ncbi:MAG: N-acetylmuramoyl-L-alanine amidase [Lachnospiraceae bacterium]|nr:N-acetylmuramoyl-L-alanine amidase [Lachnospiraceae bacterium]
MRQRWEWGMGIALILMMVLLANVGMEKVLTAAAQTGVTAAGESGTAEDDEADGSEESGAEEKDLESGWTHIVAIDSGHGGIDPGKVGVHGEEEKDINLAIAQRVQSLLEANDILVVMTRDSDEGLYDESDSNKKMADLTARCALINESGAELAVSIHQNSYHDASVCGPQMFYYRNSEEGERLARCLQQTFLSVQPDNTRDIKYNDNYYILLHVNCPVVVAECGFLSNWEESELLMQEEYQEQVAWAITMGILTYLNT